MTDTPATTVWRNNTRLKRIQKTLFSAGLLRNRRDKGKQSTDSALAIAVLHIDTSWQKKEKPRWNYCGSSLSQPHNHRIAFNTYGRN